MTWINATKQPPTKPGRYAVWFAGPTWVPAFWSPERGWADGLKVLHGVRAYHPVPDVPQTER